MLLYIKQGVNETLELTMPFDVTQLSKFTIDLFQHGSKILTKTDADCTVTDSTISTELTQNDTLLLSPQRVNLCFRGLYADGGTVIIEDLPVVIGRSPYQGVAIE